MSITKADALEYHERGRPGKTEVTPTKPCLTQRDLSLAYTPGVAYPCLEIAENPRTASRYTNRANLVAVISNGTAVLGLGNIGALAGKPVMEGKGVLFKRFAGIDVFDIELDTEDPEEVIRTVEVLEPTFGGINLEDIKAPECFLIEERLRKSMNIPVFHDDQHGTAIISGAGLLNAAEIAGKELEDLNCVFCGAGAAGIACAEIFISLGVKRENVILTDTKGVVFKGRTKGMNPYKERLAVDTPLRTLEEALVGADVFVGVAVKDLLTKDMVRSMAPSPIVFAMANPDPEISYPDAKAARPDVIIATGRSDYPNQINNVLGFPFIFRGALDVRATSINEEMKIAAAKSLASLAKEDVPDSVIEAYGGERIQFGPDYIIPKPFDPRVLLWVAPAVAMAATESGVALKPIESVESYSEQLQHYLGATQEAMRVVIHKAQRVHKRIVYPDGEADRVIRAAPIVRDEHIGSPILLGREEVVLAKAKEYGVDLTGIQVIDPVASPLAAEYAQALYESRRRKGMRVHEAAIEMRRNEPFGMMMLEKGAADGCVFGIRQSYANATRMALRIGLRHGVKRASGVFVLVLKGRVLVVSDAVVNISPSADELAEIAILAADAARVFDLEPRVAMLSFSNFGTMTHGQGKRVREATRIARELRPDLVIDGEMHPDVAFSPDLAKRSFPMSRIQGDANVLVFPDLGSGNIGYKLIQHLAGGETLGPILVGIRKPVNLIGYNSTVADIVNISAITTVSAGLYTD
jgi:malate dehydrogenase (oxaloacetate-decarboxylating)(NADP+)